METVGDCEEGLSGLQTRSHSASLAAVLRVQGRIDFYRQTAAVTAPLRSKNRRLLKVCNPDSPSSQSAVGYERVSPWRTCSVYKMEK